jgi:hypothetical protein
MGKHSVRRRGAAFALAGAVLVGGGTTIAMTGVGAADPLPALNTTYVLPDLAPFTDAPPNADTRGAGTAEVTDEFGAPEGGHKAALKLSTPADADKVDVITSEDSPLASWVGNAAYSAYQDAAANPIQFPAYQLIIDYNGAADGGYSTLDYEPVYNDGASTAAKQWNRYDVGTTGKLCSTKPIPGIIADNETRCDNGGTHTLAEYVAAAPDATVTALQINQGSGNPGLVSAVDRVQTPATSYDFELTKPDDGGVIPPITIPPIITPPTTVPTEPGNGGHPGNPGHGGWGDQPGRGGHCGC